MGLAALRDPKEQWLKRDRTFLLMEKSWLTGGPVIQRGRARSALFFHHPQGGEELRAGHQTTQAVQAMRRTSLFILNDR